MTVNREAFREIHELITQFPDLHDQRNWEADPSQNGSCGTTRCIAGWATWLKAREMGLLDSKGSPTKNKLRGKIADRLGLRLRDHGSIARTVLGLTSAQAESLFHDYHDERAVARVKSYAETGADLSEAECLRYED